MQQAGKLMMFAGGFILLVGIAIWAGAKYFHWFGNLPGDVKLEKGNMKFYMPVTTMLLLSLGLSLLFWFIRKYLQ